MTDQWILSGSSSQFGHIFSSFFRFSQKCWFKLENKIRSQRNGLQQHAFGGKTLVLPMWQWLCDFRSSTIMARLCEGEALVFYQGRYCIINVILYTIKTILHIKKSFPSSEFPALYQAPSFLLRHLALPIKIPLLYLEALLFLLIKTPSLSL